MSEFDYFSERAPMPAAALEVELPEALRAQIDDWRRARRRAAVSALTASVVVAVSTWFLWSYRDLMAYAFSAPRQPLVLGAVFDLTPADIPHNAYVEVGGVTEHRGLKQQRARSLWPKREELWYFRLAGSRGVFIEVVPDPERFAFATEVTVRGRAVDPARESLYRDLVDEYRSRFFSQSRDVARVIQVDYGPGAGRLPFVVLIAFLAVVAGVDLWSLRRYARAAREQANLLR